MSTPPDSPPPPPPSHNTSRPASPGHSADPEEASSVHQPNTAAADDNAGDSDHAHGHEQQPQQPSQHAATVATAGEWQAIYSPPHNAYYFYNTVTQETTWSNPVQPSQPAAAVASSSSASPPPADQSVQPSPAVQSLYALQAAAAAQGIDPSLAHLDPSLAGPSTPSPAALTYTAKFNARTGAFARPDGRDPSHLSEYERAKRMSLAYFDVGEWEKEVEERHEEEQQAEAEGRKRKRPTKKDLERFKEQKRLKKIAKTAWLRT